MLLSGKSRTTERGGGILLDGSDAAASCAPRVAAVLCLILLGIPMNANEDRSQARSMVISRYGVAATEHPFASQAAIDILRAGGNAVDAAVTANAVMGLVAPMSNGIGGDLFAIVY